MPPDAPNALPLSLSLRYPVTRTDDQVDDYHGTLVPDPYRWLEDDTSEETGAWVAAQNEVTFAYLDTIPWRAALRERLTELVDYPRVSQPEQRGRWYLFARNDGLQNQAVWYLQDGEDGAPEVLLDPNTMSADGTTRVSSLTFSADGSRIAYMVSDTNSN